MQEELNLPEQSERVINPSDIRIYHMTEKGQEAFRKGIPFLEMIKGEDYTLAFIIDYKKLVAQRIKDNTDAYVNNHKRPRYSFKLHNAYAKRTVAGLALLLGAVSPAYSQSIPDELPAKQKQTLECRMTEENLFAQYFVINKDGSAYLRRIHLDKSDYLNEKRCLATYDAEGLEPRVDKNIIHFGKGVYEVQGQK